MLERLLVTVALILPAAVFGQTAASVPRPEVKVGDSWTYNRINRYTNQVTGTFVNVVRKIEGGEITMESRSEDGQGGTLVWVFASDWNLRKRGKAVFDPGIPQYAFPLEIGKKWEGSYTGPSLLDEAGSVDSTRKSKVVGMEVVKVPAGSFNAVKIESETTWLYKGAWRGGRSTGVVSETRCYAPEAKRFVKMEVDVFRPADANVPDRVIWELKELKLN